MVEGERTGPVVLAHPLPDWAVAELRDAYELRALAPGCATCAQARVALTTGPQRLDAATFDQLPKLDYLIALGSGCEGIDRAEAARRGIVVSNSAVATAADVADHTVAIVLACHGGLIALDRAVRADRWHKPRRVSLAERNVGIVGLGAIGAAVASRLAAFGCPIRWTGPRPKPSPHAYVAELGALADWADILIVAARADVSNARLIDRAVLDRLGPDGLLANVARGGIVDEDALIAALRDGRLGGAALDVFAAEPTPGARWRDVSNVVLSPHVGGYATGVQRGIARLIRANLDAFFARAPLIGVLEPPAR